MGPKGKAPKEGPKEGPKERGTNNEKPLKQKTKNNGKPSTTMKKTWKKHETTLKNMKKGGMSPRIISHPSHLPESHIYESQTTFWSFFCIFRFFSVFSFLAKPWSGGA